MSMASDEISNFKKVSDFKKITLFQKKKLKLKIWFNIIGP